MNFAPRVGVATSSPLDRQLNFALLISDGVVVIRMWGCVWFSQEHIVSGAVSVDFDQSHEICSTGNCKMQVQNLIY